jgi:hypothetical protein
MKSFFAVACLCALLAGFSTTVFADTLTFHESWSGGGTGTYIDVNGGQPKWWSPKLDFPDAGAASDYSNGVPFEYDNYYANALESFTITIKGYGDNSSEPIDFFLDFDADHSLGYYQQVCTRWNRNNTRCREWKNEFVSGSGWFKSDTSDEGRIGGIDVKNTVPFTIQLDIKNNALKYYDKNGLLVSTRALNYVTPATFVGVDALYLGIGCHFYLKDIWVDVAVSQENPPQVPEPSTILFMGMPLIGLVAWRLRKTN